jgi:hypothetical protein
MDWSPPCRALWSQGRSQGTEEQCIDSERISKRVGSGACSCREVARGALLLSERSQYVCRVDSLAVSFRDVADSQYRTPSGLTPWDSLGARGEI